MTDLPKARLRVGFVGTGFIAAFHLRAMVGVRNVEVTGVFSRQAANRERICKMVDDLGLGSCRRTRASNRCSRPTTSTPSGSCLPNDTRLDVMRVLHQEV
jgi:ornithine cyclodeaminase/alanine dehydrogenase-like protein (mu-crystallin family)